MGKWSKIFCGIFVFIIVLIVGIYLFHIGSQKFSHSSKDYQYVASIALQQAEIDMGKGCEVLSNKYDDVKKEYQIVIANEEGNRIITYLVDTNNNYMENYSIKKFVDRQLTK